MQHEKCQQHNEGEDAQKDEEAVASGALGCQQHSHPASRASRGSTVEMALGTTLVVHPCQSA